MKILGVSDGALLAQSGLDLTTTVGRDSGSSIPPEYHSRSSLDYYHSTGSSVIPIFEINADSGYNEVVVECTAGRVSKCTGSFSLHIFYLGQLRARQTNIC
eukprot:Filipodium_phascolosomae@DN2967_c0_g1_i1.p1